MRTAIDPIVAYRNTSNAVVPTTVRQRLVCLWPTVTHTATAGETQCVSGMVCTKLNDCESRDCAMWFTY